VWGLVRSISASKPWLKRAWSKGYSVLEMVGAFEATSGRDVPYRVTARRPGDVASCYADPRKAGELLEWSAKRTLSDMCASTWNFQQSAARSCL